MVMDVAVVNCWSLFCPVLRVYGRVGHGDVCRVPALKLCPQTGHPAANDRHLLTADRSVLSLTVHPI